MLVRKSLGMSQENYDDPFFDVLSHIGLSSDEIDTANDYVFGYNMIEGAPGLKTRTFGSL